VQYRFGEHTLDQDLFELRCGDRRIDVQPKVLEVLGYLLENADRAVPKEEILEALWPDIAVGDAALTRAISHARRALGDQDRDEGIIRTVRGRGYRIGIPVVREKASTALPAAPPEPEQSQEPPRESAAPTAGSVDLSEPSPSEANAHRVGQRWMIWAGGLAAVFLGLGIWLGRAPESSPAEAVMPPRVARPPPRTAVAVLPFDYLSGDGMEHLADGFTEAIITALSRSPELQVAARTSSFTFKGRHQDVRSVGTQLGVGSVLEGSVRVEGGRLRVTAQLVEASGGFHLWSEVYDRAPDDIFAVQDEIAAAIAAELQGTLADEPAPSPAQASSFEAYQLYLRGRSRWALKTESGLDEARELFQRALALDPDYAAAHSGLSDVYRNTWSYVRAEPRDGPLLARAEEEARLALALDRMNAEAHASLASAVQDRHRDWEQAEALFLRALELNVGWAVGHLSYGTFLLIRGRLDEARPHLNRALELDPLSPMANTQVGRAALYAGDPEAASVALRRALELNPNDPTAPRLLYLAYEARGMPAQARETYLHRIPKSVRPLLRAVARAFGNAAAVRCIVSLARVYPGLSPDGPWGIALGLAYLGDDEPMYDQLELAEVKDLSHIRLDPVFDPYRRDPRFVDLIDRTGYGE